MAESGVKSHRTTDVWENFRIVHEMRTLRRIPSRIRMAHFFRTRIQPHNYAKRVTVLGCQFCAISIKQAVCKCASRAAASNKTTLHLSKYGIFGVLVMASGRGQTWRRRARAQKRTRTNKTKNLEAKAHKSFGAFLIMIRDWIDRDRSSFTFDVFLIFDWSPYHLTLS